MCILFENDTVFNSPDLVTHHNVTLIQKVGTYKVFSHHTIYGGRFCAIFEIKPDTLRAIPSIKSVNLDTVPLIPGVVLKTTKEKLMISCQDEIIDELEIYDFTGKLLIKSTPKNHGEQIPLAQFFTPAVVVNIRLASGALLRKKIFIPEQ